MTTAQPPADADADASPPAATECSHAESSRQQCHLVTNDGIEIDVANDNNCRQPHSHVNVDSDIDRRSVSAETTAATNTTDDDDNDNNLPLEYQYHEIDQSNSSNLDPFEYRFRKYVPIPRVYFWETASPDHHKQLPFKIKLWHRSIYYLGEGLRKAEAGGEVIANLLGLNDGPFEYVTQNITEEEMARSRNILERRTRAAERRREGDV